LTMRPHAEKERRRSRKDLAEEKEGFVRKRIVPFAMALLLVVAACSSSDPAASDEYAALEQELAQSEAQLTEVTAERDALVAEAETAAAAADEIEAAAAPDDVAALTVAWGEAINTGGGAVTELYASDGFHLFNSQQIAHDDIAAHLEQPTAHGKWLTEPYLLVDEGDGRYVVARGTHAAGTFPGSVTFVIVREADGGLKIAETAWVFGG